MRKDLRTNLTYCLLYLFEIYIFNIISLSVSSLRFSLLCASVSTCSSLLCTLPASAPPSVQASKELVVKAPPDAAATAKQLAQLHAAALASYRKGAALECPKSEWGLGLAFLNGNFCLQQDPKRAFELYSAAAERGFDVAQYNLGLFWEDGASGTVDEAKAAEYLKHGGKEGYCRAKLEKQREREALELAAAELEAVAEAEAAAAARAVAEARAAAKAMAIKANEQRLFLLPV